MRYLAHQLDIILTEAINFPEGPLPDEDDSEHPLMVNVREGGGQWKESWQGGYFTDHTDTIWVVPTFHDRWSSVYYNGRHYQLFGGVRTHYWINLSSPLSQEDLEA